MLFFLKLRRPRKSTRTYNILPYTALFRSLSHLGQPVWRPRSPAGWPDKAQSWAGPHGLFARVRLAEQLGRVARPADARMIAPLILPGVLRRSTATIISEAASAGQGLALLVAAPEFLRR